VDVHAAVVSVIAVLGVALIVGVAAERLRIPYIVALLIVTLPLSPIQSDEHFAEAFLIVLLPTLIFDAAWNSNVAEMLQTWRAVTFMAVPGVLITVGAIGGGLALTGRLPLVPALLLGAIVAPTDPIAVIATFRRLKVPPELAVTVEAGLASLVVRWTIDRDLHVIGSLLVAYGAYIGAEAVHVSGIFAALFGGIAYRWFERRGNDDAIVEHVDAVYGVVAITILTQGLLLGPVMRRLPLTQMQAEA
jgi:NhaP-type Na+/H+ or K+/H+ antiporter